MKVSQARRLKELEKENGRLKRAVANLTLDKLILEETGSRDTYFRWFSTSESAETGLKLTVPS